MNGRFDNMNDEQAYRVAYLIAGYMKASLDKHEHDELDAWVAESDANMQLFERLTDESNMGELEKLLSSAELKERGERAKKNLHFSGAKGKTSTRTIIAVAIAASLVISIGIYLFNRNNGMGDPNSKIVKTNVDMAPANYAAILTLSNGEKLTLDGQQKGRVARDGFVGINQTDQGIIYSDSGHLFENRQNLLTVPFKAYYQVVLSDGTKVWLNAGSSLSYPASFSSNERVVTLTGEGYFEVAKDPSRPFKVLAGETQTQVLGTHFNINAYEDEPSLNVSLLEGSVKTSVKKTDMMLKPGEQVIVSGQQLLKRTITDTSTVVGWKSGVFEFRDLPIPDIMRQLSRWYGITVEYKEKPEHLFNATIERSVPLSKILKYLEKTNEVHFKFENQTIIVMK